MPPYPIYPNPLTLLAPRIVLAALLRRRRSFQADARALVGRIDPPPAVRGGEHLPGGGPGLLVCNHYFRPGFEAWWLALAASASLPGEVRWVITAERRFAALPRRLLEKRFLAWVGQVYGFFPMPAMPPRPEEAAQRGLAVRRVVEFVRRTPAGLVGLAPEGRDLPGGALGWPPPGAGRFMLELARLGLPVYPLGIFEEGGRLCLQAGPAFPLAAPPGLRGAALDCWASRAVMERLARLLPPYLSGEF